MECGNCGKRAGKLGGWFHEKRLCKKCWLEAKADEKAKNKLEKRERLEREQLGLKDGARN